MKPEWESAAIGGDVSAVRAQLEAGTDVDARDRYGQTALMLASTRGHLEVVRALIGAGAALDTTAKYGLSAVMLAAVNGHAETARSLAAAGADLALRGTGAPGFFEKTAADLARHRGLEDLAEALEPGRR